MSEQVAPRRILRRLVTGLFIGFVVLFLALAGLYLEEAWRGQHAWARCKSELEAQGEKLDGGSFIPPPVADDQNVAMAPLLAPLSDHVRDPKSGEDVPRDPAAVERLKNTNLTKLGDSSHPMPTLKSWQIGKPTRLEDWQRWLAGNKETPGAVRSEQAARGVLEALEPYSSQLAEFGRAVDRPFARFPLQYEKGLAMPISHAGVFTGFAGIFCLRALAELETGDTEAGLRDLRTIDRAGAALQPEPLIISHLVRMTVIGYIPQILGQGIAQHRWSEAQLKTIQEMLSRIDLLADHQRVMRGERALLNDYYARLRHQHAGIQRTISATAGIQDMRPVAMPPVFSILPQSVMLYHNQVYGNRWLQELFLPVIDAPAGRVYPRREAAAVEILKQTQSTPYNFLAKLTLDVYPTIALRTAAAHVLNEQAVVACALERFRLKNGKYPETLRELVSDYLSQPPQDVFSSEALQYRREENGQYILYSVGWNEEDDGGVIAIKPGSPDRRDDENGDWVWFGGERK